VFVVLFLHFAAGYPQPSPSIAQFNSIMALTTAQCWAEWERYSRRTRAEFSVEYLTKVLTRMGFQGGTVITADIHQLRAHSSLTSISIPITVCYNNGGAFAFFTGCSCMRFRSHALTTDARMFHIYRQLWTREPLVADAEGVTVIPQGMHVPDDPFTPFPTAQLMVIRGNLRWNSSGYVDFSC